MLCSGFPASAEVVEGRTLAKGNAGEEVTNQIQGRDMVSSGLDGVRMRAKADKECCFTALLHHIDLDM